jgi:hypothetical protein
MAKQPVYRLIFLQLSPRFELRTLTGYNGEWIPFANISSSALH